MVTARMRKKLLLAVPVLFSGQLCNDRGKVLHLCCLDLKVREPVEVTLLKQVGNRLFSAERPLWNEPSSLLGGERGSTIGDFQIVDRLAQFQVCEALASSFFDPGDLLLQSGVCRVRTVRA